MLKTLRRLIGGKPQQEPEARLPLGQMDIDGLGVVDVAPCLMRSGNFLFVDWPAVEALLSPLQDDTARSAAWGQAQQAWLECMAATLGDGYHVVSSAQSLVLSAVEPNVARASLQFLDTTRGRIVRGVLKGIAQAPAQGKAVLIVLNHGEEYYDYVSHFYPTEGEFAASAGIYIHDGRSGHFLVARYDLSAIEPTIAHELTHACLAHLRIPAWLNEGLAVNTEARLSQGMAVYGAPMEMHRKLQAWWNPERIQEFWCGRSFKRADEGCELSYELGRILVEQMAMHWASFEAFCLHADWSDAGQAAAQQYREANLGAYVCALLEQDYTPAWEPDPSRWNQEPEKGAF